MLDAEWHTSVSGPPSEVAERATRKLVEHGSGGVDAAGEVDGQHGRQARELASSPARAADGREGRDGARRRRRGGRPAPRRRAVPTSAWCRWRTASVRMPRSPFSASYGDAAGAVQHAVGPDGVEQVPLAGDHAERGVVVAGDALGRRVHDEVDAVADRLLADRRGERRVEHRERPADGAEVVEVDEVEAGVRGALGDDEHRPAGAHRRGEGARLRAVDDGVLDAEPGARPLARGPSCRRRSGAG